MMDNVTIGKFTIESLTTGMYTDPFVIFREYIQNSADSIDDAIDAGLVSEKEGYIQISIDRKKNSITIEDNGLGLSPESAQAILTDIGNSKKAQGTNRGFRGIGRFSGLSYCDRLTFTTSSQGADHGYSISYDAKLLRQIILEDESSLTAGSAMAKVISEKRFQTSPDHHYFRVILENVREDSGLLSFEKVLDYLRQVAPVPFDRMFSWGQSITDHITKEIGHIDAYNIALTSGNKRVQITKYYTDTFLLNRQTGATDQITSIEYFPLKNITGDTIGLAWYGISSFLGTIIGHEIKGLRARAGNILIGDHTSFNHVFKDQRFNGWIIGEIYIKDPSLIPNARRDDFEHNDIYYLIIEQLQKMASDITKAIRVASVERNKSLHDAVSKVQDIEERAESVLRAEKLNPAKKGSITSRIIKARHTLEETQTDGFDEELRQSALNKLDILTGRIQSAGSFRAINLLDNLTKNEKQFLDRIFVKLVEQNDTAEAEKCINMILATFTQK